VSYSLLVSGHAEQAEQDALAAKIGLVLHEAGPAVSSASWSGNGFSGDPRELVKDSEASE
jgi:hypothetical protein